MSKRLLFGDDGSANADAAWLWINSHEWPGWVIEILTAVHGKDDHAPDHPRALLNPAVAAGVTQEVVDGDPRVALLTHAEQKDLLVIGARGRGILKDLHLGSTAEWLIHGSPTPMVVVRGGHRTRRVLVAHDDSTSSRAAVEAFLSCPWAATTEVRVLSVAELGGDLTLAAAAADRIRGRVGSVEAVTVSPEDVPAFTRPRDLILESAGEWEADLIVLGRTGLAGWDAANEWGLRRAGRGATGVASHATCSVLLA